MYESPQQSDGGSGTGAQLRERFQALLAELDADIRYDRAKARLWNRSSLLLLSLALSCSFGAGVLGLLELATPRWVGAIALLPGSIAVAASQLNLRARTAWHHLRRAELLRLRSKLLFHGPLEPTLAHIASIANERDDLVRKMQQRWDKTVPPDWERRVGKDPG